MRATILHSKKAVLSVLFTLLLCVAGMSKASAVTIGDLNYSLNSSTLTATVTGHKDGTAATGNLIIPSSVTYDNNGVTQTYTVVSINQWAFHSCSGLTGSLTIPNSVTRIGLQAFEDCSGFTGSLVIGNLMLAAHALGLGSCWINRAKEEFDSEEGKQILKELGIEGDYEGIDHLVVGYPAKQIPAPLPRKADYVRWAE